MVKEAFGSAEPCSAGEPIACGATVRLEHVSTERSLHTHHVQSPLSNQHEVSCYLPREEGDTNDNWTVLCAERRGKSDPVWRRGARVTLRSPNTGAYLHSHSQHRYTQRNCPNCPIVGQQEVTGFGEQNPQNFWVVSEGIFIQKA